MSRRGVVMGFSLGLVTVLATLSVALLTRSLNDNLLGHRSADRLAAFHLAEGGLDRASINLRTPTDATDDVLTQTLSTGSYTIESTPQLSATTWQATVRGNTLTEQRRLEAVYRLTPQSVFEYAMFGNQGVSVSGNAITDSYSSTLGPYNDDENNDGIDDDSGDDDEDDPNVTDFNFGHNGDVGTNATNTGGVTVGGSIFVDGQVAVGPGVSDPESVVAGYDPAFITGGTDPPSDTQDVVAQTQTFPMPPVTLNGAPFTTNPFIAVLGDGDGDCADLTVSSNDTTTLPPTGGLNGTGQYCYSNLTVQGGGDLTSDGSGMVKVYLTGQLTAQGNSTIGVTNDPTQMLFLITSTGGAVLEQNIQGNNTFYGAIYGPGATVTIQGNAEIFGSVIANQVNVQGNASIHYDEALTTITEISNTYQRTLVSWRDLN